MRLARIFSGKTLGLRHDQHGLQEIVIKDHDADTKIAVIEVEGFITGALLDGRGRDLVTSIKDQLKKAEEDEAVKAVILKVDSPGGEVLAADEINRAIMEFQKDSSKPVIASLGGLAASGGYYVSVPCQWIVAHELTITGSIGVIMHGWNYRGLLDKVGVRPEIYKSGKYKDMLSGDKREEEITPEERRMAQTLIDQTFARFKTVVGKGREEAQKKNLGKGQRLIAEWEQYADGRILLGKEALGHGFVDELGNFDTAVSRAKALAGLRQANLIRYEQPFDLMNVFRWLAKTEPGKVQVELNLDLPRLQAGRLYFLAPTLWN
jgi:protease-4